MKQVKTIKRVMDLAREKKCVVIKRGGIIQSRVPAAMVQNFQAIYLQRLISAKQVFEYKKK